MKLFQTIILFLFFYVFCFSSVSLEKDFKYLCKKNREIRSQTMSTKFIFESFKATCEGKCFSSLNEWQQKCKSLWDLEYIAWSNAEDFMDVSYENCDDALFYGVWISKYGKYEVYCRKKNDKNENFKEFEIFNYEKKRKRNEKNIKLGEIYQKDGTKIIFSKNQNGKIIREVLKNEK